MVQTRAVTHGDGWWRRWKQCYPTGQSTSPPSRGHTDMLVSLAEAGHRDLFLPVRQDSRGFWLIAGRLQLIWLGQCFAFLFPKGEVLYPCCSSPRICSSTLGWVFRKMNHLFLKIMVAEGSAFKVLLSDFYTFSISVDVPEGSAVHPLESHFLLVWPVLVAQSCKENLAVGRQAGPRGLNLQRETHLGQTSSSLAGPSLHKGLHRSMCTDAHTQVHTLGCTHLDANTRNARDAAEDPRHVVPFAA